MTAIMTQPLTPVRTTETVGAHDTSAFGSALESLLRPLCFTARLSLVFAVTCRLLAVVDDQRSAAVAELNAEQRGRRTWHRPLPDRAADGRPRAQVPCWTSREAWLTAVTRLVTTEAGVAARRQHHRVSVDTVLATAKAHAHYAETRTGRYMMASLQTLATRSGLSVDRVRNGRRVLRTLGLLADIAYGRHLTATEIMAARAHHGGTQRGVASEIALTMTPEAVAAASTTRRTNSPSKRSRRGNRAPRGCAPLSRQGVSRTLSLFKSSTSSEEKQSSPAKRHHRTRTLALQKLAAGIVARCRGLDPVSDALASPRDVVPLPWRQDGFYQRQNHLGRICDVLDDLGIDPAAWTAPAVVARLNHHGRAAHLSWPNQVDNPAAYLRWRLTQLDWIPASPTPSPTATPQTAADDLQPAANGAGRARAYAAAAAACGWSRTPGGGAND